MEKIEYAAEILYLIEARQQVEPLPEAEIDILKSARQKLGFEVKPPRF
jgi:hypothetical protein